MATLIGNANSERITLKCGADAKTTTSQYKVALIEASMTADIATATADFIIGIIDSEQSASSESVSIIYSGIAKGVMMTATTCAIGAILVCDADGHLDTAITASTAQVPVGRALNVPITGGTVSVLLGGPFWKTVDLA